MLPQKRGTRVQITAKQIVQICFSVNTVGTNCEWRVLRGGSSEEGPQRRVLRGGGSDKDKVLVYSTTIGEILLCLPLHLASLTLLPALEFC